MKIICIGRNYGAHAKELKNEIPDEPVFFLKPDTALLKDGQAFYLPDFSKEIHHEIELVLQICKNGKNISEKFASSYYEKIAVGIDFTARDVQQQCKEKGLPWEKAKAFDNSAPIGEFISKSELKNIENLDFQLTINGEVRQKGNSKDMLFSFEKIIAYVSRFITLKQGDLIYTGTPAGVGAVAIGDKLVGYIGDKKLLSFEVK
ncbi:MAG TPA: fumarylacetoacetate hydrolase family protein [Bacteroidia bacterium]|nr:fumarylacetoacetate hydrolase family protein [Bacteroidia bacterium]HRH08399.1 fumarylacetoacetate hydrolase family protein [Bacteroidia bacterium]HRH63038.1 fumarylacetoacetate hydrolase family protein [Bacteroidia bacterium]